jgi:tellurite resistance protein TerC
VVAAIIGVSIALSLRATRGQGRREIPVPTNPPFRLATEAEIAEAEPVWGRRRTPVGAAR